MLELNNLHNTPPQEKTACQIWQAVFFDQDSCRIPRSVQAGNYDNSAFPLRNPDSNIFSYPRLEIVPENPSFDLFLDGYTLAAIIFTGWGIFWGYFPQFSHLGWI
jgi:hypothetical protein